MPLEIVFLEPQNWASAKTPLLNPYYRLHGFPLDKGKLSSAVLSIEF